MITVTNSSKTVFICINMSAWGSVPGPPDHAHTHVDGAAESFSKGQASTRVLTALCCMSYGSWIKVKERSALSLSHPYPNLCSPRGQTYKDTVVAEEVQASSCLQRGDSITQIQSSEHEGFMKEHQAFLSKCGYSMGDSLTGPRNHTWSMHWSSSSW